MVFDSNYATKGNMSLEEAEYLFISYTVHNGITKKIEIAIRVSYIDYFRVASVCM